jgi:hypothetical protein
MSKFVSFPLQLDGVRIVYPDDIALFADTVVEGETVHAVYLGALDFPPSDHFRQRLLASVIVSIKQAAFVAINELDGEGGWRRQRADDKKALGDSTLFDQLLASREAIRSRSNALEAEVAAMTYDELLAFDPLDVLRQAAGQLLPA